MAYTFLKLNNRDSAIYYCKKSIEEAKNGPFFNVIISSSKLLVGIYTSMQSIDSSFKYQELISKANDSLFALAQTNQNQNISFVNELHQQQEENIERQFQNQKRILILITIAIVLLLIGIILWRNNRN